MVKLVPRERGGGNVDKLLLKPSEVSDLLGIGRTRIYAMLGSGELPSVRIGGSIRVPADALKAWLKRIGSDQAATCQ
jgi:excisionase family DNA binding protein